MKSSVLITVVLFCGFVSTAQTNKGDQNYLELYEKQQIAICTKPRSNLVVLFSPPTDGTTRAVSAKTFYSSRPINIAFISTTNTPLGLFILRPEYGFRVSAFSETGEPVAPTYKGKKYGSDFESLKAYDKKAIDTERKHPSGRIAGTPDHVPNWVKPMPSPDELFKFEKPGKYTMIVEAACFATRGFPPFIPLTRGSYPSNFFLVKFPPVKLQIIKPEPQ